MIQTQKAERGLSPTPEVFPWGKELRQMFLLSQSSAGTGPLAQGSALMAPTVLTQHCTPSQTTALSQLNWEGWNHPQELKMLPQQTQFSQEGTLRTQHLRSSKPTRAILMPFLILQLSLFPQHQWFVFQTHSDQHPSLFKR